MTTFYRVHQIETPFSAENAWSSQMGLDVHPEDVTLHECLCGVFGEPSEDCDQCGGDGWVDRDRGYSCCWTAEDLIDYYKNHGTVLEDDRVIIFEGEYTQQGGDGEPLAVPTRILAEMTWKEFVATVA